MLLSQCQSLFLFAGLVPRGAHLAQGSDRVGERGGTPCCRVSAEAHLGESRGEKVLLVNCLYKTRASCSIASW